MGQHRLGRFGVPARGYCGWLLTTPRFLAEHDQLFSTWQDAIFIHWLPSSQWFNSHHVLQADESFDPAPPEGFVEAFSSFCRRWRLSYLEAPYLPCPLVPQVPAPLPKRNHPTTGVTFYLPDTFPIPSRDELREMLEDALRGGERLDHLAEWQDKVRSDKRSKNAIERYGRLFVLQHLWFVLHYRHAEALRGKVGRLKRVLAHYLLGDPISGDDTIHKDLQFIRRRLGDNWYRVDSEAASSN
jgi:hypothetical protein